MVGEIKWTVQALEDIENIANYIAKDSFQYASIQTKCFFEQVRIPEAQPNVGRIVPELNSKTIRQLTEGRYRIFYRIVSRKRIDILTVHHSSRLLSNNPLFK